MSEAPCTARPRDVLLVSADRNLLAPVADLLRDRGHEVFLAGGADEALEMAPGRFDLVVVHHAPPGLSGLALLTELGHGDNAPHTLLFGEEPSFDDCRAALRLGAHDYLKLPLDPGAIAAVLEGPEGEARSASSPPRSLSWTGRTDGDGVDRAVRAAAAFALVQRVGPAGRMRLASACAAICENARRHAYGAEGGPLHLSARVTESDIVVRIRDEGLGFDTVNARLDGESTGDERVPTGLARVASLVEGFELESSPRGTISTLRISTAGVLFDEDASSDLSELDYLDSRTTLALLRAIRKRDGGDMYNLSPSLAVTIGRILTGSTADQTIQAALWT